MKTVKSYMFLALLSVLGCEDACEEEVPLYSCIDYNAQDCFVIRTYACSSDEYAVNYEKNTASGCRNYDAGIVGLPESDTGVQDNGDFDVQVCIHTCQVECENNSSCTVSECLQTRCGVTDYDGGVGDVS